MNFGFAYPVVFVLLIPVAGWLIVSLRRELPSIVYSMTSALAKISPTYESWIDKVPLVLRTLCLVLLVFASARPQLFNVSREIRSPGVDIMLCIDTSGSMRALDFKLDGEPVTRLTAVKKVVTDFIKKRVTDRIGLVVFGDEAFTQSPLTLDKGLLLRLVEDMQIGMAGDRTAIGSAMAVGGKRLKDLEAKSRILILLTDGRNNRGDIGPREAAEAVSALGVKTYTIGVGGKGPAPFRVETFFGTRLVHQEVDLDEETLMTVADIGNGRYFRAADSQTLAQIYEEIDRQEKTEAEVKEFFHFKELYRYFMIPAVCLLLLEIALKELWWRTVP